MKWAVDESGKDELAVDESGIDQSPLHLKIIPLLTLIQYRGRY